MWLRSRVCVCVQKQSHLQSLIIMETEVAVLFNTANGSPARRRRHGAPSFCRQRKYFTEIVGGSKYRDLAIMFK